MRIHHQPIPADIKSLDKKPLIKNGGTAAFNPKSGSIGKTPAAKSAIVSRAELVSLASDLKNGVIDRDEANRRFVAAVIDNSLKNKLGEQDREKLMEDIQEFFANDQDFVQKLAKNLHDFA